MRPLGKITIKWSPNFAYAIGLITTDGSLSKDGRHIVFTSKDRELSLKYIRCLRIKNAKICKKSRGRDKEKIYDYVQVSDILFYKFLLSIGLTPNKTKTIGLVLCFTLRLSLLVVTT
jgi:hypothetical protein